MSPDAFAIKDCALIAIATGRKAITLKELRDRLQTINANSIYQHFWGGLLEPRFEEREYNNDFAAWARRGLHDDVLAERLAMADPTQYEDIEALRQELLELIEERLDQSEYLNWVLATEPFEFIRSQIVVFDTDQRLHHPEELARQLPTLSTSSIFYHFIDARRRPPKGFDDFRLWLSGFNGQYAGLEKRLAAIDPYFGTLNDLRQELVESFNQSCGEPV
ncbi:hypothetical protein C7271_13145 [filamentous cyanobacterium CCP5]|nr:hypothetical protein C7271_13145 [filamentous cyanobacterium CCP5]